MKKLVLYITIGLYGLNLFAQLHYPETPKIEVSDTLWGTVYKDDYRWLENMNDPKVISWFKKQAELTDDIMETISGRQELIEEWQKLDSIQPPIYFSEVEAAGRFFFQKRNPGEKISKVYYRENISGEDQLLFDPLAFISGKTLSVESIIPSYDGKKLLIAYSELGAEVSTLRVLEVDSKKMLSDVIPNTLSGGDWTFDNTSFLYTWIKSTDNTDPNSRLNTKTKLHKIGTEVSADIDFFSTESYPSLKMASEVYPYVFLSNYQRDYLFAGESTVQSEMTTYYAPIDQFNSGNIQWKPLSTVEDKLVRSMDFFDGKIYAITYKDAKNYRLVATDLKNPNWDNPEIVVPEKSMILEEFVRSKDYLLLTYSDGISSHIFKYHPKTKITAEIKMPFAGSVYVQHFATDSNNFLVGITSWNKPYTQFLFNSETDEFLKGPFTQPEDYPDAYKNLVIEEVEVKGHDGAMIPLSIIYKKGIKKDGSNVCFMESYGAYGVSLLPSFATRLYSLAVKDVIIAIPHVRGGGEKGQDWYQSGFKTTKPNTWKDFISCAEYLIEKGFTSKEKLAGTATSAGGILITRAITERPDLFAAAVCNVGVANAMRAEFSSNGPANIPEFGTVKDSIESKALYEMDGMQHVKEGVKYPAVMCVAGWNDPRVVAWQPGKFAAALQNDSASDKPVLMKVNYDNGHFTQDKQVSRANFATQYAFLMWQCGHPEFQVKK